MIPGVNSALSSWSALSGRHLFFLASVAGLGATVFWRLAVNKPPRVLRRSGYRERATPGRFQRYRGDPINLKAPWGCQTSASEGALTLETV
jgi:hypothetical protein